MFLIVIGGIILYHLYATGILQEEINSLHKKLEQWSVIYDQTLANDNLDIAETGEMGYMWLTDIGLVWTEYQPERTTSVYVSKEEYMKKWSKMNEDG